MKINIGTSGWSFYDKDNIFYPKELKSKDKLEFFSSKFKTVEVNTTFYHFPRKTTIEKWHRETPENFKFIIKLNRLFTHNKKLEIDQETGDRLKEFIDLIEGLDKKLGGILVQIAGSFKKDLDILERFLKSVERIRTLKYRIFLEVRDESWIDDDFFKLLKKYNTVLVYNDGRVKWPKILSKSDMFYIRLHGREKLYYSSYSKEELEEIVSAIKEKSFLGGYIFFNNTAGRNGIENAMLLKELV